MQRVTIKIGDIFEVKIDDSFKRYFQYITNDKTQLNSDVIRVFTERYPIDETPVLSKIIKGNVDFYAHVVTKWGVKQGYWKNVGNDLDIGVTDILFRGSHDYGVKEGVEPIKVSHRWYVWKINQPFVDVGRLEGENIKAEIGLVIPPYILFQRIKTGNYEFIYPGF